MKSQLIGKDFNVGKIEGKVVEEDEIDSITNLLNGHEFEQTLGNGGGQRSLACRSSWGHKESDMTETTITTIGLPP